MSGLCAFQLLGISIFFSCCAISRNPCDATICFSGWKFHFSGLVSVTTICILDDLAQRSFLVWPR